VDVIQPAARSIPVTAADFSEFYQARFSELAVFGGRLSGDWQLGDELAQEALSRVYARWHFMIGDPRAYAYRVVANLAKDQWRATSRERTAQDLEGPAPQPESTSIETMDAVKRLPRNHRDAVLLHYFADLPVDQVARALHRPSGTVKRWLHEARSALADTLQETS
jgi:RNA polymerase sigma-70 factor (ECF subfamily)